MMNSKHKFLNFTKISKTLNTFYSKNKIYQLLPSLKPRRVSKYLRCTTCNCLCLGYSIHELTY